MSTVDLMVYPDFRKKGNSSEDGKDVKDPIYLFIFSLILDKAHPCYDTAVVVGPNSTQYAAITQVSFEYRCTEKEFKRCIVHRFKGIEFKLRGIYTNKKIRKLETAVQQPDKLMDGMGDLRIGFEKVNEINVNGIGEISLAIKRIE